MNSEYMPFFELKEVDDDGTFVGVASVYGVEDLGGDVIDKGAFKKTITENPNIPILWQHKRDEVIGKGTVSEWQGKILLKATLDLEDAVALKAHRKMKNKLISGLSIGFNALKHTFEEVEQRTVRHITELKLWEVSVVTFPMLPAAQVTRVKDAGDQDGRIAALEAEVQALKAQVTPVAPKPTPPPEPPTTPPPPVVDHSGVVAQLSALQGVFRGAD